MLTGFKSIKKFQIVESTAKHPTFSLSFNDASTTNLSFFLISEPEKAVKSCEKRIIS